MLTEAVILPDIFLFLCCQEKIFPTSLKCHARASK